MIDASLYENVTYKQINDMKHALGFDNGNVTGTNHRTFIPYRNSFHASGKDIKDWKNLVTLGFAIEQSENTFSVTPDGTLFLEKVTGITFELEQAKLERANFDECRYNSIKYTSYDIFGHDDYECYCSISGEAKRCNYFYCMKKCKNGVKKQES